MTQRLLESIGQNPRPWVPPWSPIAHCPTGPLGLQDQPLPALAVYGIPATTTHGPFPPCASCFRLLTSLSSLQRPPALLPAPTLASLHPTSPFGGPLPDLTSASDPSGTGCCLQDNQGHSWPVGSWGPNSHSWHFLRHFPTIPNGQQCPLGFLYDPVTF